MSYSPLQRGTAQYMQLPLQYQWNSEPVFPATQFISNSSSTLHFTRITHHRHFNSSSSQALGKPTGGPVPQVAIVRRHAHDSLLACIQSLLSEPSLSLLCFPFPPCSAGCRMHTHTRMQLQNSALPDSPPLSTPHPPSISPLVQKRTTVRSQPASRPAARPAGCPDRAFFYYFESSFPAVAALAVSATQDVSRTRSSFAGLHPLLALCYVPRRAAAARVCAAEVRPGYPGRCGDNAGGRSSYMYIRLLCCCSCCCYCLACLLPRYIA